MTPLLEICSLTTQFVTPQGILKAVDDVSLTISPGEVVALVGESGSGKTVTAFSIIRLLPPTARIAGGRVMFAGQNLLELTERRMTAIRGKEIGFVLQDPLSALNPVMCVGEQIAEVLRHHLGLGRKAARQRTLEIMEKVQLPNPAQLYRAYPHELSGGLRQRVLIAIALACQPRLLIADEPTTALDVSIQSQILALLQALKAEFKIAVLLITHDLSIVSQMSDRVAVMYAGKIVELGSTTDVFTRPLHPYTAALLEAVPRIEVSGHRAGGNFNPLGGQVPDLHNLPAGCAFHPRCALADGECRSKVPESTAFGRQRYVRCLKREESSIENVLERSSSSLGRDD